MIRFLFRLLAMILLAIAVLAAVVDGARSLSAQTLVLTSLSSGWSIVSPDSLAGVQAMVQNHLPTFAWDRVFVFILGMPAAAVLGALAALAYAIGAKREKPFGEIRVR